MAKIKSDKSKPAREEAIARRAYELYLKRAGKDGADLDDWLEAERLLRSEQNVPRDTNAHLGRRGAE